MDIQSSVSCTSKSPQLVWVGILGKPYGTGGKIKLRSFCLDPGNIEAFSCLYSESGNKFFKIEGLTGTGEDFLAVLEGIRSREDAARLKGTKLYANRDEFPSLEENEYYYSDLQNLRALDSEGKLIGTVISMNNFGAGDLMELHLEESGNKVLIPFTKDNVLRVEIPSGYLVVDNVPHYL